MTAEEIKELDLARPDGPFMMLVAWMREPGREIGNESLMKVASHMEKMARIIDERNEDIRTLSSRIERDAKRIAELETALKPFATIGALLHAGAEDNRWHEAPLLYCGTVDDPQSHTLLGIAFDRARQAVTPGAEQ